MVVWYNSTEDGTIEEYIEYCNEEKVPKCFKGYKQFQNLIKLGYIEPLITNIRIMYGFARSDEHYVVDQNFNLEGIILNIHSGKKGIHNSKDLLSEETPYFEIHMINPCPEPRKIN